MEKAKKIKEEERERYPVKILLRKAKVIRNKIMGIKDDNDDVDLDAMFNDIKKAKKEKLARDAALKEAVEKSKQKRRFTDDGLPIFTEAELKMDNPKAGTTPLCPFDCDCCF